MRYLNSILLTALIIFFSALANANDGNGDTGFASIDLDPPELSHTPGSDQINGSMPVLSVVATDKQGLASVRLLHRTSDQTDYKAVNMNVVAGSNQYMATIDRPTEAVTIEYYFLAVDVGGNQVLSGVPYQPYTVPYTPIAIAANPAGTESSVKSIDSRLKWALLGALAITVLISSSQSSDGSDTLLASGSTTPGTVPVVVTIPTP